MIRIPEKQIIINNVNQIRALKYDASGVYVDIVTPAAATDGFFLEGFLQPVLFSALKLYAANLRIKAQAAVAPVKQIATFTVNATVVGSAASEVFRLTWDSLDKSPTDFQGNVPLEKRYQLSATLATNATVTQVAASIAAQINADKNAPVTAVAAVGVVTLTAKDFGISFAMYSKPANQGGLLSTTFAVTTPATLGVNNYSNLKNINWAKNLDFDRNVEYFPEYDATYKSYRFVITSTGFSKDQSVANAQGHTAETEICLWVKTGLALITTLDLIIADANGALA